MVQVGDPAPEFTLPSDDGSDISLRDVRGKKVVLYFYPKDDTSGCTTQACDMRDNLSSIQSSGAVVLGVSPDPVASHVKFREKFHLNFPLLSDQDHQVAEAYGVWKEKSMYGRKFWGIERSTFLIDENGVILDTWRNVKAKGHALKVRDALGLEG
jgi:thioredoxin-dependent peroxiredoxin